MRRKIMKLFGVSVACATLLSAPPVAAQCRPRANPCAEPCMEWLDLCGDWEFGIHALYYSPIACEFDYATTTQSGQGDPVATINCQFGWGVRVFAHYLSDCKFANASYQWFGNTEKRSIDGLGTVRNLSGILAVRAQATVRTEYQNADFRFGQYLYRASGCNLYVFGNARWIDLLRSRYTRAITAAPLVFNANDKSTLEGGAIGIGGGAEFNLWCNVGLFGDLNVLGVIAQRSTRKVFAPTDGTTNLSNRTQVSYASDTCINPEIDFKIGVNYTYTCDCISLVGELGYEVDYFWNAFAFPKGSIAGGQGNPARFTNRFRSCQDVGFSGLFFGGRILF